MTAVNVDGEVARSQPRKRAPHAALELIVRCAFADRFAYSKCEQFAYAQRRRKRKRRRTGGAHGMEIERDANANHNAIFWRIFEEPPAAREYVVSDASLWERAGADAGRRRREARGAHG
jgi:hypothetical protein